MGGGSDHSKAVSKYAIHSELTQDQFWIQLDSIAEAVDIANGGNTETDFDGTVEPDKALSQFNFFYKEPIKCKNGDFVMEPTPMIQNSEYDASDATSRKEIEDPQHIPRVKMRPKIDPFTGELMTHRPLKTKVCVNALQFIEARKLDEALEAHPSKLLRARRVLSDKPGVLVEMIPAGAFRSIASYTQMKKNLAKALIENTDPVMLHRIENIDTASVYILLDEILHVYEQTAVQGYYRVLNALLHDYKKGSDFPNKVNLLVSTHADFRTAVSELNKDQLLRLLFYTSWNQLLLGEKSNAVLSAFHTSYKLQHNLGTTDVLLQHDASTMVEAHLTCFREHRKSGDKEAAAARQVLSVEKKQEKLRKDVEHLKQQLQAQLKETVSTKRTVKVPKEPQKCSPSSLCTHGGKFHGVDDLKNAPLPSSFPVCAGCTLEFWGAFNRKLCRACGKPIDKCASSPTECRDPAKLKQYLAICAEFDKKREHTKAQKLKRQAALATSPMDIEVIDDFDDATAEIHYTDRILFMVSDCFPDDNVSETSDSYFADRKFNFDNFDETHDSEESLKLHNDGYCAGVAISTGSINFDFESSSSTTQHNLTTGFISASGLYFSHAPQTIKDGLDSPAILPSSSIGTDYPDSTSTSSNLEERASQKHAMITCQPLKNAKTITASMKNGSWICIVSILAKAIFLYTLLTWSVGTLVTTYISAEQVLDLLFGLTHMCAEKFYTIFGSTHTCAETLTTFDSTSKYAESPYNLGVTRNRADGFKTISNFGTSLCNTQCSYFSISTYYNSLSDMQQKSDDNCSHAMSCPQGVLPFEGDADDGKSRECNPRESFKWVFDRGKLWGDPLSSKTSVYAMQRVAYAGQSESLSNSSWKFGFVSCCSLLVLKRGMKLIYKTLANGFAVNGAQNGSSMVAIFDVVFHRYIPCSQGRFLEVFAGASVLNNVRANLLGDVVFKQFPGFQMKGDCTSAAVKLPISDTEHVVIPIGYKANGTSFLKVLPSGVRPSGTRHRIVLLGDIDKTSGVYAELLKCCGNAFQRKSLETQVKNRRQRIESEQRVVWTLSKTQSWMELHLKLNHAHPAVVRAYQKKHDVPATHLIPLNFKFDCRGCQGTSQPRHLPSSPKNFEVSLGPLTLVQLDLKYVCKSGSFQYLAIGVCVDSNFILYHPLKTRTNIIRWVKGAAIFAYTQGLRIITIQVDAAAELSAIWKDESFIEVCAIWGIHIQVIETEQHNRNHAVENANHLALVDARKVLKHAQIPGILPSTFAAFAHVITVRNYHIPMKSKDGDEPKTRAERAGIKIPPPHTSKPVIFGALCKTWLSHQQQLNQGWEGDLKGREIDCFCLGESRGRFGLIPRPNTLIFMYVAPLGHRFESRCILFESARYQITEALTHGPRDYLHPDLTRAATCYKNTVEPRKDVLTNMGTILFSNEDGIWLETYPNDTLLDNSEFDSQLGGDGSNHTTLSTNPMPTTSSTSTSSTTSSSSTSSSVTSGNQVIPTVVPADPVETAPTVPVVVNPVKTVAPESVVVNTSPKLPNATVVQKSIITTSVPQKSVSPAPPLTKKTRQKKVWFPNQPPRRSQRLADKSKGLIASASTAMLLMTVLSQRIGEATACKLIHDQDIQRKIYSVSTNVDGCSFDIGTNNTSRTGTQLEAMFVARSACAAQLQNDYGDEPLRHEWLNGPEHYHFVHGELKELLQLIKMGAVEVCIYDPNTMKLNQVCLGISA